MNGDFASPELEFNARLGYKHYINQYLNLNFNYNIFNLANEGVFNEGFMSFDLNAEVDFFSMINSLLIFLEASVQMHSTILISLIQNFKLG